MSKEIVFPEIEPDYVFDRDCLAFPALVDGKSIACFASGELLMHRFGATAFTEKALREALARHKAKIHSIARHHIEMGWVNSENQVILTTHFTTLQISFGDELRKRPAAFEIATMAQQVVAELVGPSSGEVAVKFDWEEKDGRPIFVVMMHDTVGTASNWFYMPKTESVDRLRVWLNRLWGELLQIRSRKLIQRFG